MKKMHELKQMLCDELDRLTTESKGKQMSTSVLDMIHKLTDTIKNIDKIMMLESDGGSSYDGGYSQAGMWEARINGNYGDRPYNGGYGDGYSQARRGGYNRRNSRDGSMMYDNDSSYRRGYSRDEAKDEMVGQLEDMMGEAEGRTKDVIKNCLDTLKRM